MNSRSGRTASPNPLSLETHRPSLGSDADDSTPSQFLGATIVLCGLHFYPS